MQKQNGVTAIELLVVIAVIAVLAAGVLVALQRARVQAENSDIKQKLSELEGTQSTIKSEGDTYKGYESGSLEDGRLQDISDAIERFNEVGFDRAELIRGESEGYGVVTPTVTEDAIFCFSSKENEVRRLSNEYDDSFDYAHALANQSTPWDCPEVSFKPDDTPEFSTDTSYAQLGTQKLSDTIDPKDYNQEVTLDPQDSNVDIKKTGSPTWSSQIDIKPSEEDNFQLRTTTPSSPGSNSYPIEVINSDGNTTITQEWALKSDYVSCKDVQSAGYSTTGADYAIDPSGKGEDDSIRVLCNMDIAGGGWTLIASHVTGNYFYDCSDVGMKYGDTCRSVCSEITDNDSHCYDKSDREEQDAELERLSQKYIIEESEASAYRDITQYQSQDYVSNAYHRVGFDETMFADDTNDWITYNLADAGKYFKGSPGNTKSMKDYYATMPEPLQMETIVEYTDSNRNPAVVNECNNFDLVLNAADNEGSHRGSYPNYNYNHKYSYYSPGFTGPQWDSANNHGCRYDDASSQWKNQKLGGEYNNDSDYILWYVR